MNNHSDTTENIKFPVVTFSNIPLDDEPAPVSPTAASEPASPPEPREVSICEIQFKRDGKIYYFSPGDLTVPDGAEVIIETARGPEFGYCVRGNHPVPTAKLVQPLRPVLRLATQADKAARAELQKKVPETMKLCQKKIQEHGLEMKLLSAEYSFDGSKILFYFTAAGRVDFRELVRDLASVFHARIELRQIGVRDEAKLLGGLGICGRPFCCHQFLEDFQPVSIKMAKTQKLSLNPTKISGACGRLMCCLQYEQETYEALLKTTPKTDSLVNTCDGLGTVTEANVLKQSVKVRMENDASTVKCYQNCEICVLRSGKAKKSDPPIPTDLPPLPKKQEPKPEAPEEDIPIIDETTLFRHGAPEDAAQPAKESKPRPKQQKPGKSNNKRRNYRKRKKPSGESHS